MRKHVVFLLLMITCFLGTACGIPTKQKILEESVGSIQDFFTSLNSYHAVVEIEIVGNKGSNSYVLEQWYKAEDQYRTMVISPNNIKGKTTVSTGGKVMDFLPTLGIIEEHEGYDRIENEFFLNAFIERLMQSEDATVDVALIKANPYTVYEVKIPGEHPYFAYEKLWMDHEKYMPHKLVIYDKDKKEQVIVIFKKFDYNIDLKEELFTIQNR